MFPKSKVGVCGEPQSSWGVDLLATLPLGLSLTTSLPLVPQSRALSRGLSGCARHSGPGSPRWPTLRWHSITLFSLRVLCPFPVFSVRFCLAPSSFRRCFPGRVPLSHRPVPSQPDFVPLPQLSSPPECPSLDTSSCLTHP